MSNLRQEPSSIAFLVLPSVADEVSGRAEDARGHRHVADRLQRALPERDRARHDRIRGQAVQLRLIAEREHRDHRRAADARRIVDRGLRIAVRLELLDARRWRSRSMSSLVPNCRQLVGHALTHAGCSPTDTRSTHSVHL